MEELYWIGRIGTIHDICIFVLVICIIVMLFTTIFTVADYDYYDGIPNYFKKMCKWVLSICVICILGIIFTPSTRELYAIYGIGSVIDYVQNNDTAKNIPDKAIKAIDAYLNEYNNKEK